MQRILDLMVFTVKSYTVSLNTAIPCECLRLRHTITFINLTPVARSVNIGRNTCDPEKYILNLTLKVNECTNHYLGFRIPHYKAIFTLLPQFNHQPFGQSSKKQESDYCSQAPHEVKYCEVILNIRDFVIFLNKINYIYTFK